MSVWNTVLYFLLVLGRLTSPNYVCQPEIADIRFDGAYDIEVSAQFEEVTEHGNSSAAADPDEDAHDDEDEDEAGHAYDDAGGDEHR